MNDKHNYLKLPNGDLIRADSIVAVRLADESIPYPGAKPIKTRVIVDYTIQESNPFGKADQRINAIIIYAHSDKHRDQIANKIIDAIVGAGHHVQVINAPIP